MKKSHLAGIAVAAALLLTACSPSPAGPGTTGPAATPSDPAVAALGGVITFGTEGTYSPFSYHDTATGELTGYDIEVAKAVGAKLGVEVKFAEVQWDGIFAALDTKRFDGVANQVEITAARQDKYDMSNPYAVSYPVVITRSDNTAITTLADVKGKSAAQSTGSNWGTKAESYGAKVEAVTGFAEAVTAVKQGRVDLTVNDALAALDYFKTTGDKDAKVAVEVKDELVSQGFAFRKDSGLLPAVNAALAALKADGTLAAIGQKYFGADISG